MWVQLLASIVIWWVMGSLVLAFWRSTGQQPREQVGWWIAVGVGGIVFGALGAAMGQIDGVKYRAAVKDIAPQYYRQAARVLVRGPMPTDPSVKVAAIRLADVYLWRAGQRPRFFGRLILSTIVMWTGLAVLQGFDDDANPAIIAMNLPIWLCLAVQTYYVFPLVDARRALMLHSEGARA
ncbi:hypothetical protein [Mycobacterium sp. NPDC050853]|uniref:hypothetical protein n=1 Tax=Mycobacterium sp. NPDC050853 TaxID=3155160 RepID=UPI0033E1DF5E